MFGLFKRVRSPTPTAKPPLADEKKIVANVIADLLQVQLSLLDKFGIKYDRSNVNHKAIGYIYGFTDAFLTLGGHDMSDLDVGMPITFHVFRKIFPGHNASDYIEFLMRNMHDDLV